MKRFVRTFVTWLLFLALPVQGFTASTMLLCAAGHHGAAQAAASEHDHAGHVHIGTSSVADALGSHSDHDQAIEATPGHDGGAVRPVVAKHAEVMGKCSACAACCTVAFLPTTVISFTAPAPSRSLPVFELTTHIGFVADGPDKPPRLALA